MERPANTPVDTPVEKPGSLEAQQRWINERIRIKKRRIKTQGTFNASFWAASHEVESLILQRAEVDRKISLRDFKGTPSEWEKSDAAKSIFQTIKAQETTVKICKDRKKVLEESQWSLELKGFHRASFRQLFTTSKMGLGVSSTGAAKCDSSQQSTFRAELIRVYDAKHPGGEDALWCPISGTWFDEYYTQAVHLFPDMHGQVTMDAIFGKRRPEELFSARNGLIVAQPVARWFDSGKIVIVPDLPERPAMAELLAWMRRETREYRLKVIDPTWERLDKMISCGYQKTWREADGKRLEFRTSFRPAARYLYFHYCVQVLRRAWTHNTSGGSFPTLRDGVGKPFWGTPGRYLPKNMLLSLFEALGHEYNDLLDGARWITACGDENLLLEIASSQIKTRPAFNDDWWGGDRDDDESESEDSETDWCPG